MAVHICRMDCDAALTLKELGQVTQSAEMTEAANLSAVGESSVHLLTLPLAVPWPRMQ